MKEKGPPKPPKPPENDDIPIPLGDTNAFGREMIKRVEAGDAPGAIRLMKQVFPDPPEPPKLRPIQAEIRVPIEAIDGTASVGAALLVSNDSADSVALEISGHKVVVRLDQLAQALQSIAMLKPRSFPHMHPVPMPVMGC